MDRPPPTLERPLPSGERALPTLGPAEDGACCAACAAGQPSVRPPVPILQPARPMIQRGTDRRITFDGVLVAAGLLGLAGLSASGAGPGSTPWLPIHLAMAGAAGTAIAAVMPFFTAALAQAGPAWPVVRVAAIVSTAGGAILAGVGMTNGTPAVAAAGGAVYLGGLLSLATAAFAPLRSALGRRLRLVHLAYAVAIVQVAAGVFLATASLSAWSPVSSAWGMLKPAHAWLNVFGFVVLVVAASLVHLAPTVAGARIRPRTSVAVAISCLAAGAPIVALGYVMSWDLVARGGALVEVVGAVALTAHAASVQRDRGRWTSDLGWHRFASLSLLAAPVWLLVGVAIAAGRVLWIGATPGAWLLALVAIPLVIGGIGQVLIGSWSHLVPAIGPGDQIAHALQRRWLGRLAISRWLAWNTGVALATTGVLVAADGLVIAGGGIVGVALALGLGLLVAAVLVRPRRDPAAVV